MKPIFRILLLVTLIPVVSRSAEYAEFGDNVITYFRGSPIPDGLKKILRLGTDIEDSDDRTTGVAVDFYESDNSKKPMKKYKNKKHVNKYLSSDNSAPIAPLAEYKLNKALQRSIDDMKDVKRAADKAQVLRKAKAKEELLNNAEKGFNIEKADESVTGLSRFHMDPVLNMVRSDQYRKSYRRQDGDDDDSSGGSSGSDAGNMNWKDEWTRLWRYKKHEALNAKRPRGDNVNMIAARPWGVPCGDPNQHDMPWGNCMLAVECEAEYRIYRGDFFCGRTNFVCCGLQVTSYDLYQGFDASFDDKSLSTDSDERREEGKSKNKDSKKKQKEKKKRKREREKRKKKIKNNIEKIVKEIRKILDKAYKNGTKERKRKTRMFKKFVKHLKKQYKKDRLSIKELHEETILKIDAALMERLNQIRAVNEEFMNNQTFAEIIITGKTNKAGARMLMEAYPELTAYFTVRRSGAPAIHRRGENNPFKLKPLNDYLDYDVEYGFFHE